MRNRIASPEMLSAAEMLPHLICSRPIFIGGLMMRRISMAARDELVAAVADRYAQGDRGERSVEAMERHSHVQLVPQVRARLLAMSAVTIDRALRDIRRQAGTATRRRSAPSAAIRRSVPVRTFDDRHDPPPGFVEANRRVQVQVR
jgi:hypothetical protein